jgi:hypothetical protein
MVDRQDAGSTSTGERARRERAEAMAALAAAAATAIRGQWRRLRRVWAAIRIRTAPDHR